MAKARKKPSPKASLPIGTIALGGAGVIVAFLAVFLMTNNISVSLGSSTENEKYSSEAFVEKREGDIAKKKRTKHKIIGIETNGGMSASMGFNRSSQQLNLEIVPLNRAVLGREFASRVTYSSEPLATGEHELLRLWGGGNAAAIYQICFAQIFECLYVPIGG